MVPGADLGGVGSNWPHTSGREALKAYNIYHFMANF